MEKSSAWTISPGSPTGYAPDAFRAWPSFGVFLGLIGLVLAILIAAWIGLFAGVAFGISPKALQREAVPLGLWVQLGLDLCIALYLVLLLPGLARTTLSGLGFRAPNVGAIGAAFGGAIAMVLLVNGVGAAIEQLTHTKHEQEAVRLLLSVHSTTLKWVVACLAILVAPVAEELTFRVLVFNAVGKRAGFWIGALVSGVLFGLAHWDKYAFVPLAIGGAILCGVYARTRNAFMPMLTHGLFNAASVIALFFAPQLAK